METGMLDKPVSLKAGVEHPLQVDGDYFLVVKAASAVQIQFDDGTWLTRFQGDGMGVNTYRRVRLLSDADQDVIIALGYTGGARTPTVGRSVVSGPINVAVDNPTQRPSADDVVIAAGATVQVLAADADRLSALVQLDELAPGLVRVGDSSVSGSRGTKVQPDDAAVCNGSAAVWVHNPNGVAVTVSLQTERAP
ncbi:hypothetical protein C3942_21675 [Solimonas fluminis]|uniref:Uncharacterized protein n=2 Tax=Solimonas fluminis TaxID=2086571 RepID=A0A2S5TAD9_9GAMM|nr:hypothetical protein C3942_21675 [Solimonas fluminis]